MMKFPRFFMARPPVAEGMLAPRDSREVLRTGLQEAERGSDARRWCCSLQDDRPIRWSNSTSSHLILRYIEDVSAVPNIRAVSGGCRRSQIEQE